MRLALRCGLGLPTFAAVFTPAATQTPPPCGHPKFPRLS
jgi:hypothetical protein